MIKILREMQDRCRVQSVFGSILAAGVLFSLSASHAVAQNDWQFPDPYFGAIEFGGNHPPATQSSARPPRRRWRQRGWFAQEQFSPSSSPEKNHSVPRVQNKKETTSR